MNFHELTITFAAEIRRRIPRGWRPTPGTIVPRLAKQAVVRRLETMDKHSGNNSLP